MALQLIINPHSSNFAIFRRIIASIVPSVSLILLGSFYCIGSQKRQLAIIQVVFTILILITILSYMEIGSGNEGNIAYSVYGELERKKGIIGSVNEYGYYLAFLFILSIAGFTDRFRILPHKILYIPILIVTLIFILQTGSYGAIILTLFCSTLLLIKTFSLKNILSLYIIIPTLVIIIWGGVNIGISEKTNWKARAFKETLSLRSITPAYETSTILLRYELIVDGMQKVLEKSITGHGYSDRSAYSLSRNKFVAVHNAFVIESLKGGVLIGITMLLLYFRLIQFSLKIKNRDTRTFAISLLLFMFLADNSLTSFSFISLGSGTLAFTLLTIVLVNATQIKSRYPSIKY